MSNKDKDKLLNKLYLEKRLNAVKDVLSKYAKDKNISPCIVFISLSDSSKRAITYHSKAITFDEAFASCTQKALKASEDLKGRAIFIKAELVNKTGEINIDELKQEFIKAKYNKFFRMGISLDEEFETAFTEAEANSYAIYDYSCITDEDKSDVPCINEANIAKCLLDNKQKAAFGLGNKAILFTTKAYFADPSGIYELYENGIHCGRRVTMDVDEDLTSGIIASASDYLVRNNLEDGSFVYGVKPIHNKPVNSYNILRHAGTIWALIRSYPITKNPNLKKSVDSALKFMLDNIRVKEDGVYYLYDFKFDEIKLGGNGIAILALTEYMKTWNDHDYTDTIRGLADGIITMQNQETGKLTHVLNADDYSVKDNFRIVFYEGEAVFALIRAYELTNDKKYLNAATLSIDYFIDNDYVKYKDHWIAYSLNAYTKHVPLTKYFEFGLKNFWANKDKLDAAQTTSHIYAELICESYDMFCRARALKIDVPNIDDISVNIFAGVVKHRIWHMLDGYFYPEYAMYMRRPSSIVGTFMVRHEDFLVRIDDVQHFLGGYIKYLELIKDGKLTN